MNKYVGILCHGEPRKKTMRPIKEGEFIIISQGCYSDYSVSLLAKAKITLYPDKLKKEHMEWRRNHSEAVVKFSEFTAGRFFHWLQERGYIEDIEYIEINTDDAHILENEWPLEEEKP